MRVTYDLNRAPATHDFCNFLARAELQRRDHGYDRLDIDIVRGSRKVSVRDKRLSDDRKWFAARDLLPQLCWLVPSVKSVNFVDEGENSISYLNIGFPPGPIFEASDYARAKVAEYLADKPKPVSISIRASRFQPARNSNIEEWAKVIEWLVKNGYTPIIVPDLEEAIEGIAGNEFYMGAMNADFRVALYEQCLTNLMINFGPMLLCLMGKSRVMAWRIINEAIYANSVKWMTAAGFTPDSNWGEHKHLFWDQDFANNIIPILEDRLPKLPPVELASTKPAEIIEPPAFTKRGKRRPLNKEWEAVFEDWRKTQEKYGDASTRIEDISMWESIEDEKADVQVVVNILEHMPDPDKALQSIKELSRKLAFFMIELDAIRNAETWRKIIGKYFTIVKLEEFKDPYQRIVVLGWPEIRPEIFGDWTPVGPMTPESHWDQILVNSAAIKERVRRAPAHDRTAILACYGPSMRDYVEILKEEAQSPQCDVFSVSGAHDFILERGVVPRFHVECDPRPHKAGNIKNNGHEDVQYLLASCVSPEVISKLAGRKISLWHISGLHSHQIVDELESDALLVGGGRNVGQRAIGLLYEMGYRNFSIYGMDCSCDEEGDEWAGDHAKKKEYKKHETIKVTMKDKVFTTTPVLATYAADFFTLMKSLPADVRYRLWGDGLLQYWVKCESESKRKAA